jgi:ABC-2 type transport system ATP-binding protein
MGPVLEVRGLVKRYGDLTAVRGLDLTVQVGEVFAFLGPNGAGKTTTVEILEGIRPKTSGEVKVLGLDPWTHGPELQRKIGVIPQDFHFFDKITPAEGLALYASLFGVTPDVPEWLARVGLEEKANARFETLSGGQKQKLGLGLALVQDPELLFLDEPTSGLDPQARRAIWEVIRALRARGKTVFLTTHYLEEAEVLADRVGIIDHGHLVALGTPAEIIAEHGSPEVLVLTAPPALADHLRPRLEIPVRSEEGRVEVGVRSREDIVRVLTLAQESGIPWSSVNTRRDSLEDVFLRLVGSPSEASTTAGTAEGSA